MKTNRQNLAKSTALLIAALLFGCSAGVKQQTGTRRLRRNFRRGRQYRQGGRLRRGREWRPRHRHRGHLQRNRWLHGHDRRQRTRWRLRGVVDGGRTGTTESLLPDGQLEVDAGNDRRRNQQVGGGGCCAEHVLRRLRLRGSRRRAQVLPRRAERCRGDLRAELRLRKLWAVRLQEHLRVERRVDHGGPASLPDECRLCRRRGVQKIHTCARIYDCGTGKEDDCETGLCCAAGPTAAAGA